MAFIAIILFGAVGGLLTGRLLKRIDLGPVSNALAGVAGGGLVHQAWIVFVPTVAQATTAGRMALVPQLLIALTGGAAFVLLLGLLRNLMAR